MRKNQFPLTLAAFFIVGLFSCQNANKTTNAETAPTLDSSQKTAVVDSSQLYGINTNRPEAVQLVREKLAALYKDDLDKNLIDSLSRTFTLFEYDLNEDNKKEILVAQNGPYFCGSGGCTIILFSPEGNTITTFTVTRTPVIVLPDRSNGWNDLLLESNGKFHRLKFDGKKYPSNPSTAPVFAMIPGDELPRLLNTSNEPFPNFTF